VSCVGTVYWRITDAGQKHCVKKYWDDYADFLRRCEQRGIQEVKKLVEADMPTYQAKAQQVRDNYRAAVEEWSEFAIDRTLDICVSLLVELTTTEQTHPDDTFVSTALANVSTPTDDAQNFDLPSDTDGPAPVPSGSSGTQKLSEAGAAAGTATADPSDNEDDDAGKDGGAAANSAGSGRPKMGNVRFPISDEMSEVITQIASAQAQLRDVYAKAL
jgi:hypothetical protein